MYLPWQTAQFRVHLDGNFCGYRHQSSDAFALVFRCDGLGHDHLARQPEIQVAALLDRCVPIALVV